MEWVNVLKESQRLKSGGRRNLRKYGICNAAEITQPFAEMRPETVTRLLLNWLTLNAKEGQDVQIRIAVPEEQAVYKSKIYLQRGACSFGKHEKRQNYVARHCITGTIKSIITHQL